jgi:hypothetical protein
LNGHQSWPSIYDRAHERVDRGVWVSFECATNGTEQNRKESAFKSCFLFFFSSKRRSDIESVHVKQVVKKKVDQEGRPASLLPFD